MLLIVTCSMLFITPQYLLHSCQSYTQGQLPISQYFMLLMTYFGLVNYFTPLPASGQFCAPYQLPVSGSVLTLHVHSLPSPADVEALTSKTQDVLARSFVKVYMWSWGESFVEFLSTVSTQQIIIPFVFLGRSHITTTDCQLRAIHSIFCTTSGT